MIKRLVRKKGLSPVITNIILVALVIVIISVIFFWFRGMIEEGVTKFGKNIQLVCEDVQFEASYDSGNLNVVNEGNIPLYNLNIKTTTEGGSYTTESIKDLSNSWPTVGLKQGESFSSNIGTVAGTIELNPVLIGTSKSGKKTFICGGDYGQKISA